MKNSNLKAISGGLIVDANGIKKDSIVLIEGDRIRKVFSRGGSIPSEAEVIDASKAVLMPGLIDCHVHFTGSREPGPSKLTERFETRLIRSAVSEARDLLEAGFTSVIDAGGLVGFHVRNAVNEGIVPGPRIMSAGRYISVTGGHGDTHYLPLEWVKEGRPMGWGMDGRIADGVDECLRAVREQLREGVDMIKICTSGGGGSLRDPPEIPEYSFEEIKVMADEAHSWGRRVIAHCYNPEAIRRSVMGGVDVIAHGNLADENSIKLMREHGTIVVPTMSIYHRIEQRRAEMRMPQASQSRAGRMYQTLFGDVKRLHDGGITLAMGTDTMGAPIAFGENAMELELYVEKVGLPAAEALKIGTLNGAKAMGNNDLGTIEAGKLADIIAIEGNPLDDMKVLTDKNSIKMVMKGGSAYKKNI